MLKNPKSFSLAVKKRELLFAQTLHQRLTSCQSNLGIKEGGVGVARLEKRV